ncbi:hypothetical protein C4561_02295 [candidate division WWE3 bacterium]|jgi:VIT1/CCC1 family predicted Fe2+/Mn2+ transporter|uniref:VIT family protein n=1 Tax=candidate division WWE3 bacterium TaxID=2053526 RepID=A0A3A4ZDT8_UNCKA|nr:MAG: hypothetical protein C4561_02295 [candidate division WWE3 bacterium]
MRRKKIFPDYVRNIVFGAEDSLVSTVGVLFGLASSNEYTLAQLMLVGVTLTSVEALSMGVGSYLSETEIHELDHSGNHKDSPIIGGLLMYFSYLIFGIVVLAPYLLFGIPTGKFVSIILTFISLYFVGYFPTKSIREGLRMFIVAGIAIIVGFTVTKIFENVKF